VMVSFGVLIGAVFTIIVGYVGYEIVMHIPYFIGQVPNYWHGFRNFFM
jgi:hypothetical protein